MTDFGLCFEGGFRDGAMPCINGGNWIVSHDQLNLAYKIEDDEFDDFVHWVALNWQIDRDPWQDGECARDYLDRIGVSIREA